MNDNKIKSTLSNAGQHLKSRMSQVKSDRKVFFRTFYKWSLKPFNEITRSGKSDKEFVHYHSVAHVETVYFSFILIVDYITKSLKL